MAEASPTLRRRKQQQQRVEKYGTQRMRRACSYDGSVLVRATVCAAPATAAAAGRGTQHAQRQWAQAAGWRQLAEGCRTVPQGRGPSRSWRRAEQWPYRLAVQRTACTCATGGRPRRAACGKSAGHSSSCSWRTRMPRLQPGAVDSAQGMLRRPLTGAVLANSRTSKTTGGPTVAQRHGAEEDCGHDGSGSSVAASVAAAASAVAEAAICQAALSAPASCGTGEVGAGLLPMGWAQPGSSHREGCCQVRCPPTGATPAPCSDRAAASAAAAIRGVQPRCCVSRRGVRLYCDGSIGYAGGHAELGRSGGTFSATRRCVRFLGQRISSEHAGR